MENTFTVHSKEELAVLLRKRRPLMKGPSKVQISLRLSNLTSADRTKYETRLSKTYSECGCSWGAILGMVGVAAYLGVLFGTTLISMEWVLVPAGLVFFIVLVAMGKLFGLMLARMELKRVIREIISLDDRVPLHMKSS